jgi:acylphosphatase
VVTRFRASVTGRVQGVGYRASAAHEGRRLGLHGWVRNRFDGTVEVEAQAEQAALDSFLVYLRHGPPGARVKTVDVEWLPVAPDLGPFEIR